jgi:hypothetical protein
MNFGAPVEVKAAGEHIVPAYRAKPDIVDFDGDGLLDMVLASGEGSRREATHIMLYKNVGSETEWELAAPVPLQHEDGSPVDTPVRTACYMTDWDEDGDLDLMTGAHTTDSVRYLENVGSRTEPRFSEYRRLDAVNARMNSHHEVGPCPADLDGDGRLDLIVGHGDTGHLHFFRRSWLEGRTETTLIAIETEDGQRLEGADLERATAAGAGAEIADVPGEPAEATDETLLLAHFDGEADTAGGSEVLQNTGEFVEGRFDRALHFTDDQFAAYPAAEGIAPSGGEIACWVRPDWSSGDDRNHYIVSSDDGFPNNLFWLLVARDGSLVFQASDGALGEGLTMRLSSQPLNWKAGEWHFLNCRWSPKKVQLFVDGVEVAATGDVALPSELGDRLYVGNLFNGAWCFEGAIDDLHIRGTRGGQ